MTTLDLIYEKDCPNVGLARLNLAQALQELRVHLEWTEYRIGDPDAPDRTRGYGSPTVLVDGEDVAGLPPSADACCRIYFDSGGVHGAPSVPQIAEAIRRRSPLAKGGTP